MNSKFYITKYALTQGIVEWECSEPTAQSPKLLKGPGLFEYAWSEGNQWHRTLDSAKDKCESMRKKKIDGLRKQIKKLESMKF